MGVLTDDMTRLNDEINVLKNARREFLNEQRAFVQRSREAAAFMLTLFNAARTEGTKEMRARMHADNTARAMNVREEIATNETQRTAEARHSSFVRAGFLDGIRGQVDAIRTGVIQLRTEFAADVAGAHFAWEGLAAAERPNTKKRMRTKSAS